MLLLSRSVVRKGGCGGCRSTVEALSVDDARSRPGNGDGWGISQPQLGGANKSLHHCDHTTELLSQRAVHSEPRGDGMVKLSARGFGIDRLIRRPLFMLCLPNLLADVR